MFLQSGQSSRAAPLRAEGTLVAPRPAAGGGVPLARCTLSVSLLVAVPATFSTTEILSSSCPVVGMKPSVNVRRRDAPRPSHDHDCHADASAWVVTGLGAVPPPSPAESCGFWMPGGLR